jgi:hypothetical protein
MLLGYIQENNMDFWLLNEPHPLPEDRRSAYIKQPDRAREWSKELLKQREALLAHLCRK